MSSSARPANLEAYEATCAGIAGNLTSTTGRLRAALDHFRASDGWRAWLDEITPLDVDLVAVTDAVHHLGAFVGSVGRAFAVADTSGGRTGVVRVLEADVHPAIATPWAAAVNVVRDGDRTIVLTGAGDDHVRIFDDGGTTYVEVNGHRRALTPTEAQSLVIRTGAGADRIEVDSRFRVRVTVLGGDGNDVIGWATASAGIRMGGGGADVVYAGRGHDRVDGGEGDDELYGGEGHDYLDGQDGDDRIFGGDGTDTGYGGRGGDALDGGTGRDHLEGGTGDDQIAGGGDNDSLSGGFGDDTLAGDAGDDRLYGGDGTDGLDGGGGRDVAFTQGDDEVASADSVTVELIGMPGSYAIHTPQPDWMTDAEYEVWLERISSDIAFLRSSPTGRQALEALDSASRDSDSGWDPFDDDNMVTLVPAEDSEGAPAQTADQDWALGGDGTDSYVSIDPHTNILYHRDRAADTTADWDQMPPPTVLFHELAHAYDHVNGSSPSGDTVETDRGWTNTISNAEVNAVGLDTDGDGTWNLYDEHPSFFTENALRREMGLPEREHYGIPSERY